MQNLLSATVLPKGGEGAVDVAKGISEAVKEGSQPLQFSYNLDQTVLEKIQEVNTKGLRR